ncbi:MAG: hypothetical protein Q4E86_10670 [Lachnospiraceae bacterium]|nr:hypothetical protein [Lachnospiraceae bacterium]
MIKSLKKVCKMDSLKFILGVIAMVLCMGAAGAVIWILLFGVPKGAMDGGTLVDGKSRIQWMDPEWTDQRQPSLGGPYSEKPCQGWLCSEEVCQGWLCSEEAGRAWSAPDWIAASWSASKWAKGGRL